MAQLRNSRKVTVDAVGNLYIADTGNYRIRKVNTQGVITTIAGNGVAGFKGDGGSATLASLYAPKDMAVDAIGNIYIADRDTYVGKVRKVGIVSAFNNITVSGDIPFVEENETAHIMSSLGRHQKTIDLNTGVALKTFGYDIEGNLETITDQFGNITHINWFNGIPTSIISHENMVTQLTIDPYTNNLTHVTYPDQSYYYFDYRDGLMELEVDPKGNRFTHHFGSNGRLEDVYDEEGGHWNFYRQALANGDIQAIKTTAEGNVTAYLDRTDSTGAYTTTITGPSGGVSTFTRTAEGLTEATDLSCGMHVDTKYDLDPEYKFKYVAEQTTSTPAGKARVTQRTVNYQDTDANEVPDLITRSFTLNGKTTTLVQNVLQATKENTSPLGKSLTFYYDPANLLTTKLSVPGLYDTTFAYDTKGRLTTVNQNGRQTYFTYTDLGFLESITDPTEQTTTYEHDAMGRVTVAHRPDGSLLGFSYDNNGNMTVLTNPAIISHSFGYNGVDLKTAYDTPSSGSYRYFYDKDRRLIETEFPSGKRIVNAYTYDQLTQTQTPEGNIDFTYLCATKLGSMSKGGEAITFTYDGSLVTSETSTGTLNQALSYSYNNDFMPVSFSYAGQSQAYGYDNDGLLTSAGTFTISRNAGNGLPEAVSDTTYSLNRNFNGFGEIEAESLTIAGQADYGYSLNRDPAGRITIRTETLAGITNNYVYSYDTMGRLLTVTKDDALVEEYRYNANGSREYEMNALRGISGRSLSYDAEDHLLTAGDTFYHYSLDGFLTGKTAGADTTSYNYSSRGELLSASLADGRLIEYVHDPQGRRVAKKVDGVIVEKYLWQGLTKLLAVYDGNDALLQRFTYVDSRLPATMTNNGSLYYLGYDQVGSLRIVTDASGNIVKQLDYDSFGNILNDSNTNLSVPFGFAGGLHDKDINLVRFGIRDYDPETGRWTAKDPIKFFGGSIDLYGYVQNDPVNLIDPLGLQCKSFGENFVDNFSLTNEVLIGNHVKTGLGLLTSSAMAKRVGTVSVGMAASNWWRTGTIATGGMAVVNTFGSIVANSAINAAAVTVALEAGIGIGSALNAAYQTYFQNDDCPCP